MNFLHIAVWRPVHGTRRKFFMRHPEWLFFNCSREYSIGIPGWFGITVGFK